MKEYFAEFAGYNAWANDRLYDAAALLSEEQYREDRGAFFKSVHGTLNHLLVTDHIWMRRFTGTGDAPDRLDAILHENFAELREARAREDARIVAYIDSLDEDALAGTISYVRVTTPEPQVQALTAALAHFFNHQTHHRGQAHCLLTAITGTAPELDLLFYQRLLAAGPATPGGPARGRSLTDGARR